MAKSSVYMAVSHQRSEPSTKSELLHELKKFHTKVHSAISSGQIPKTSKHGQYHLVAQAGYSAIASHKNFVMLMVSA